MPKDPIVVMKFGGSVLKDADGFKRAAEIIKAEKRKKIVVVSAIAGVTDELYKLVELATMTSRNEFKENNPGDTLLKYREIWSKHLAMLRELDIKPRPDQFTEIAIHLEKVLDMISFVKEANSILTDAVVSQGEKFSAVMLSALVSEHIMLTYLPAQEVIKTTDSYDDRKISWLETKAELFKCVAFLNSNNNVMITEGFVAGTKNGRIVTLGRNGSDYSAAIIGSVLPEVAEVQFWKDVDGVMTADPKLVSFARSLECIGYEELIEATRLGSKILHPEAIAPLFESKDREIKVVVKNVTKQKEDGTEIKQNAHNKNSSGVRMITALRELGIFSSNYSTKSIEHLAPRIYLTLRQANVEFATNSQGFSDQNFTIIVHKRDFDQVRKVIDQIIGNKLNLVRYPVAQIVVIGSKMHGKPGIAGRFFTALGQAGVNILTIQQGSSECSMAATIDDKDVEKALLAVHSAFDL